MKNNLQLLIDHLQAEYDCLKSSMDACLEDWDYEGALALRAPLIYTRNKLKAAKCLLNPNYKKISDLTTRISRMKKFSAAKTYDDLPIDDETRERMERHFERSMRSRMENAEYELEQLKAKPTEQRLDDDTILNLLIALERDEIQEVEFEIKRDKVYLALRVSGTEGELSFRATDKGGVGVYFRNDTKMILRKLGFDTDSYTKQIPDFLTVDKLRLLEELAIIYFEVFGVFGEEVDVRVR